MSLRRMNSVPLGNLLEVRPQNGYSPTCSDVPTGKWVLGLSALDEYGLDLAGAKPAPLNDPLVDRFQLKAGDFLISRSNTLDRVGRIGVFHGGLDNCTFPDLMMRFRPDPKKINPEYLETFLRSEEVTKFIQQHATGTSGSMKKINQRVVESIPIFLPPPTQQLEIAALLRTWYSATEKTERLIAAKERHLHALYQRLFGFQSHSRSGWGAYKLSDLLIPRNEYAVPSNALPLYSLTIEDGVTPKTERYAREFLVKDAGAKQYAVVHPGDIVFNPSNLRWGAIARATTGANVVVSPIYEVLKVREDKVNGSLLGHVLTCPRQIAYFATQTEGTLIERMAVKLDAFLRTRIFLPRNEADQTSVAALLDEAKREIGLHKCALSYLRKQKRGLMQKLLTGQWRLNVPQGERT